MSIRTELLANVTDQLNSTSIGVSTELPWESGTQPLYQKNMKKLYIDELNQTITQLHTTLDRNDVFQTETIVNAYLTVDAKNQPSDIDTVVTSLLNSKNAITSQFTNECSVNIETLEDKITYTFEYRFLKVT